MSDLISVIVPAYNVENYIGFCLRSIASQTYSDIEVLCVDDGSTDSTADVIESFCNKDSRFRLIKKSNGGVSSARNLGIENAKGKYISFIDSDDYIAENFLERLHSIITEYSADIARCNGRGVTSYDYTEPEPKEPPYVRVRSKIEALSIFYDNVFRGWYGDDAVSACMSLYSADVLKNVRFSTVLKRAEDECFTQMVIGESEKVVYCGDKMYFYYRREGSACHVKTPQDEMLNCMKNLYATRDEYFIKKDLHNIALLNSRAACDNFIDIYMNDESDASVKSCAIELFSLYYKKQQSPPKHHKLFNLSPSVYSLYTSILKKSKK